MSQPVGQPVSSSKIPSSISVGLILITIISLALVGYTALNPHVTTLTQQQIVTNTQNVYNTQTQTVMSYSTQTVTSYGTITALSTTTSTANLGYNNGNYGYNYGNYYNGNYQSCGYYGCNYHQNPGYSNYYNVCQSTASNSMVQCSGWLYQSPNGCIVLAIPIDNASWAESRVYQYYTLLKLPSSYHPTWTWITVTGQLYQGYNYASNGASCPGNYIIVNTVTPQ